jgi:hypothetical protein
MPPFQNPPMRVDLTESHTRDTAKASKATADGMAQLIFAAAQTEHRERRMLGWTIAGVILAGVAAVASIIAIIVAFMLA